jgi:thiol:disulfide interchange protein
MIYKKKLISLCFLLLIILESHAHAALLSLQPEYSRIPHIPGKTIYLPIKLSIPENGYIYANPKGPGTGKPLKIHITTSSEKEIAHIRIDQPEKYYPPQEDNWVWRYRGVITLYVPLTLPKTIQYNKMSLNISVDALFCSALSCTPLSTEYSYFLTITPGKHISKKNVTEIPGKTIILGVTPDNTTSSDTATTGDEQIDTYTFFPQYISETKISGILQAILFSLLAGILLNVMPCVLPVISLKIMSFMQHAHQDRKKLMLIGFTYTGGVLLSFLLLASLVAFAGHSWGSLFQTEIFLILMIILIFSFSLSLLGIYTIGIPTFAAQASSIHYSSPYIDAFMKGLLATLLATPCSGPFLGGTLAWTLSQSPLITYIIFISIAIGMALPYLILSCYPRLISFIPKPGEWTLVFEKVMGFLLLATVVYLVTLLSHSQKNPAIWMLLILALGLWIYGRQQQHFLTKKKRLLSLVMLIFFFIISYIIPFKLHRFYTQHSVQAEPFSMQTIIENSQKGGITIVEFTADWCPNCRLVEAHTLYTDEFAVLLKKYPCTFLKADITQPGTEGEQLLRQLGSQSIPFLAIFPPGKAFTKPLCIRDIYTIGDITKGLKQASQQVQIIPEIKINTLHLDTLQE